MIESCKLNDVDPQAWLADVLARLPDHPASQIEELLPWRWKAARVDAKTPAHRRLKIAPLGFSPGSAGALCRMITVDHTEPWEHQRLLLGLPTRMRPVLIYTTDSAIFVA